MLFSQIILLPGCAVVTMILPLRGYAHNNESPVYSWKEFAVRKSRGFVAVLLVAALAVPAFGQNADLKWKFEKGKKYYQELSTKTEQKMNVMGMDITQNQEQTF